MTLDGIPTEAFRQAIDALRAQGWRTVSEYDNMDAWIDYARVVLENDGVALTFTWDNWEEGSVDGPESVVRALRDASGAPLCPPRSTT